MDDEYAEAWQYGPVFPSLYYEFKDFGADSIDRLAQDSSPPNFEKIVPQIRPIDVTTPDLLSKVWDGYGKFTAVQLSSLTHAAGTPWYDTWHRNPGWRNLHIDNDAIRAHYKNLAEKLRANG